MTEIVDTDATDDPDKVWHLAFRNWMDGNPEPMAAWLRQLDSIITDDAREFLADLVCDKVKRKRGPDARDTEMTFRYAQLVFQLRDSPMSKAEAEEQAAIQLGTSADTVRGIVDRFSMSFEGWKRYGKPRLVATGRGRHK